MLTEQIKRIETELRRYSKDGLSVWQLQSIPGVGLRTAEAIVAFIDDPHRFANAKRVRAYFQRIRRDDPGRKKIDVVATAHYLARVIWAMLKDGTLWQETITQPLPRTSPAKATLTESH